MAKAATKTAWPRWSYFRHNTRPPDWAVQFVGAVATAQDDIDTTDPRPVSVSGRGSRALAAPLQGLGYEVETGKAAAQRIRRPVLFGGNGVSSLTYEVDAVHDALGVVVEVEAGRGAQSNAGYRDLIRASLILDARYLALMMPIAYRWKSAGKDFSAAAYADTRAVLDAVYASRRLPLPFDGVLLVGY